ncbi:polyprenyl synthetase family protein [Streptomyces albulus]|nr:polyprenyl synthetase family protein [Streptomyces noursei]
MPVAPPGVGRTAKQILRRCRRACTTTTAGPARAAGRPSVSAAEPDARASPHEGHCETNLDQAIAVQAAKTAESVRAVCCLPALLTDASSAQVEAVGRFGWHLGMAVQYHNDLSDLWPAEPLNRSRYGDVRRRKITPTVVACLESGHHDSGRLAEFYGGDGESAQEQLAAVADLTAWTGRHTSSATWW